MLGLQYKIVNFGAEITPDCSPRRSKEGGMEQEEKVLYQIEKKRNSSGLKRKCACMIGLRVSGSRRRGSEVTPDAAVSEAWSLWGVLGFGDPDAEALLDVRPEVRPAAGMGGGRVTETCKACRCVGGELREDMKGWGGGVRRSSLPAAGAREGRVPGC